MSFIIQEQASPVLFEIGKEEPTGAGGTIDFYLADQDFLYFEGNASANFAIDLAYDAATTLDDALNVDDLVTVTLAAKNGSTPYYLTNFQIDGGAGAITINWQNGEAPSSGKANEIDYYTFKVLKTSGNTYTVFASVVSTAYGIIPNRELTKASAATASETIYYARENIVFFQGTGTTDVQLDLTFATGQTLDSVMATGDVFDFGLKITNAGSAAELINVTVDSGTLNNLYYVGNAPTAIPSAVVSYDLELVKVGSASFNLTYEETKETGPLFFTNATNVEILVIAGGGGGGSKPVEQGSGGGGAGGLLYFGSESPKTPNGAAKSLGFGTYTVTVGAGGGSVSPSSQGNDGFSSSFIGAGVNISATGGGGGGGNPISGRSGGSGGGGAIEDGPGGSGISGQGFSGGNAASLTSGGGGGAAGAASLSTAGNGLAYSISGTSTTRAGGGGSAGTGGRQSGGGTGGGGAGSYSGDGGAGTINTGSGGGGGATLGGAGGKGVVIVKYPDTFPAAITTGSPTVDVSGGFRRYTFNDSGTFQVT